MVFLFLDSSLVDKLYMLWTKELIFDTVLVMRVGLTWLGRQSKIWSCVTTTSRFHEFLRLYVGVLVTAFL